MLSGKYGRKATSFAMQAHNKRLSLPARAFLNSGVPAKFASGKAPEDTHGVLCRLVDDAYKIISEGLHAKIKGRKKQVEEIIFEFAKDCRCRRFSVMCLSAPTVQRKLDPRNPDILHEDMIGFDLVIFYNMCEDIDRLSQRRIMEVALDRDSNGSSTFLVMRQDFPELGTFEGPFKSLEDVFDEAIDIDFSLNNPIIRWIKDNTDKEEQSDQDRSEISRQKIDTPKRTRRNS